MRVEYKGSSPHYSYSVEGNVLYVEGEKYDLDKVRKDSETEINIYDKDNFFVANIIIPPNEYELKDTGETDENGAPVYEKVLKPLNMEKVRLILWSKREKPENTNLIEEV